MKGTVVVTSRHADSPPSAQEHDDASSNSSKGSMDEHSSVSSMTSVTGSDGTSSRTGSSSSEDSVNSCDSSDSGIAMHESGSNSKSSSPDAEITGNENNNNNNNTTDSFTGSVSDSEVTSNTNNINNNNINNIVYDNAGNALSITMLNGKNYYNNQRMVDQLAQRFGSLGLRRPDQPINIVHMGALTAVVPTTITMPSPISPTTSMELVWHGEFDRLFSQYLHHMWYLMPTFLPPGDRFQVFKDSAKVRFSCQCGHGWTSMKGRVVFWFYLNYCANSGYVLFKLYGQQCQRCKNDRFEHSMWYPEEVIKVIGNVYNRVGQIYYGFVRPPLRIDRRQGKPRNQHQSELCLACKEGLCKEEWIS